MDHGSMGVTGLSEFKARCPPAPTIVAKRFIEPDRSSPRREAYIPSGTPHNSSNIGCMLTQAPRSITVAISASDNISACSSRCRRARSICSPTMLAARRKPAATAAQAASPMTWKPAWIPARVASTKWSAMSSSDRYKTPPVSGASQYGSCSAAVCEPSEPSTNKSPPTP